MECHFLELDGQLQTIMMQTMHTHEEKHYEISKSQTVGQGHWCIPVFSTSNLHKLFQSQ